MASRLAEQERLSEEGEQVGRRAELDTELSWGGTLGRVMFAVFAAIELVQDWFFLVDYFHGTR